MRTPYLFAGLLFLFLAAPALRAEDFAAADRLPVDPALRSGTLENGLTYYLRENHKPQSRAELRLVVNAGSVLEEDDQQGLAHFLEHMAFNGTAGFAAGELVDFLESMGSRFGPDLNAYTSFDETVYMLQIPTDEEGLLDRGLVVLREWASRMTLDPGEIDKERGVVLSEWRQGLGAQERLRKVHWPVLFRDSRYAARLPIGEPGIIENAPPERLEAFYRDWYRPDLMAVVVVGDIDADRMEERIRDLFADLPVPEDPRPRPVYDVPGHSEMLATTGTDPEQRATQIWVAFKHPVASQGTVADYRRGLVYNLFGSLLSFRLNELAMEPAPPFLNAFATMGSVVRGGEMFSVFAHTKDEAVETGLDALMTELARVRAHGFTEAELDRVKSEFSSAYRQAYNERDKTESSVYVAEYVRNFLEDEPVPGVEVEYRLLRDLLPGISLDDVDRAVDALCPDRDMVIVASAPQKSPLPPAETLKAMAETALEGEPEPYRESLSRTTLLAEIPEPGSTAGRRYREDLGVTVILLDNGVEVWLKPTDFKNDQILFNATAAGGLSLAPAAQLPSAQVATAVVGESGLGGLGKTEMEKILAGKVVRVSPVIQAFTHGVQGSSTPADLETALQGLHLVMTEPNRSPESFAVLMERFEAFVANRTAQPEVRYTDRIAAVNYSAHPLFVPWTAERLEQVDLDTALDFYRERFADASDFRFYFVGAIDVEATIPLLERYLATLPARDDGPSRVGDTDIVFPERVIRDTVSAGIEPKSHTTMTWPARTSLEEMEMFTMRMATDILEIRLRDVLREDLGSTYSVEVGYTYMPPYPEYSTTSVRFGSEPGSARRMTAVILDEIARFKADGPTPEEVAKVQELERRAVQTGLEENGYWAASFRSLDVLGWDPERILHRLERIDTLEPEAMRRMFSLYFPEDQYTVITLEPEDGSRP